MFLLPVSYNMRYKDLNLSFLTLFNYLCKSFTNFATCHGIKKRRLILGSMVYILASCADYNDMCYGLNLSVPMLDNCLGKTCPKNVFSNYSPL